MDWDGILYCTLLTIVLKTQQSATHKGKTRGLLWNTLLHFISDSFEDLEKDVECDGVSWFGLVVRS